MVFKEEVFNYFKELSGAKRIELMCGLMSMCIPLEIRFFETILKELAKKDMNALREAELKANSFTEMETICKCDLLADIQVINESNDMNTTSTNCEIQSNCLNNTITQPIHQSSQPTLQVMPIQDMSSVAANGTPGLVPNDMLGAVVPTPSPPNASSNLSQLPSRSKLIVSLCLMSPTNRSCSTITFKALQQQLTAPKIASTVNRCLSYRKNIFELEDLFSGILLLLTMALHSPAFSFAERDLLAKQKEEVERTIDSIKSAYFRQQNSNYTPNAHPFHTYGQHQNVHPGQSSHIHSHIGAQHSTQAHTQSTVVGVGGQAAHSQTHSHSHPTVGQMSAPVPSQQYQSHPYIANAMPVTNLNYSSPSLPNMSNLRISSLTSPVSTPSPTNSPSSKSTVTSVATISPLPMGAEFVAHGLGVPLSESAPNQASYVLTAEDMGCAKSIVVSCYNCGSMGHRGDECTAQSQEEANR